MNTAALRPYFEAVVVTVSGWEIECCAPPPVVGGLTTWTLEFSPVSQPDRYWLPPALTNLEWQVKKWPSAGGSRRMLTRGGIVVLLSADDEDSRSQLPDPGHHRLLGSISGTKHGGRGEVDDFPATTALVDFLDVITVEHTLNQDDRMLVPVQGSYRLYPTRRSPKWFHHAFPRDNRPPAADDVGLLMRLT